ncbi:hypothetical protein [Spirosoma endbachense]|uniref:Uncharacterized protein n=1 Tax=Spirosoma endbachense TaxID=2666025 RepID=A0A6P1WAV6_9BACT|nr:hypothetical protein [Spirosoma endbachense]QHW01021.1 hypothetical protein GJR95_40985 [Spirosoma endbachense]
MSESQQPQSSQHVPDYTRQILEEALARLTVQQLRQLAVEVRVNLKKGDAEGINRIHFSALKSQIADLKIPGLSPMTIHRMFEVRSGHDAKKEKYVDLFWALYQLQQVEIRTLSGKDSTQLKIRIAGVQVESPDLQQPLPRKSVTYTCYCYSVHRSKIFSGELTLHEQKRMASLSLQAQAIDAAAKNEARIEFTGKWQEGKNLTLFVNLWEERKTKERDYINLIISAGQQDVFSGMATPIFSLDDPSSYFTGTFSTIYTLPADYDSIPSVGLTILKPATDAADQEELAHQIHYFLANKVLAVPREDVVTTVATAWSTINSMAGIYTGFYMNAVTSTLHRFRCIIESNGKVALRLMDAALQESTEGVDTMDSQIQTIRGDVRVWGQANQLLSLEFNYLRLSGQYRFRLLFNLTAPDEWVWGIGTGLNDNEKETIMGSRTAIRRMESAPKPAVFLLTGRDDFNKATGEYSQILFDFFTGITQPALTEINTIKSVANLTSPNYDAQAPKFGLVGLYKVYSLERRWVREKPTVPLKARQYFIVEYPLRLCADGTAWMQFSASSSPIQTSKVERGVNYLAITFQSIPDGPKLPGDYTYIHFVFWLEKTEEVNKLYGVSVRRGKVPEARVELFLEAMTDGKLPDETEDGFPFGQTVYDEVRTDTREEKYKEWMTHAEHEYRAKIVRYLSGKMNRLILLHSTATSEGDIQPRQEGHRRIYFYQACYQAQKDEIQLAVASLIRSHRHGFGTNKDDLNYLKEEKALWLKHTDLERIIMQLWPESKVFD